MDKKPILVHVKVSAGPKAIKKLIRQLRGLKKQLPDYDFVITSSNVDISSVLNIQLQIPCGDRNAVINFLEIAKEIGLTRTREACPS